MPGGHCEYPQHCPYGGLQPWKSCPLKKCRYVEGRYVEGRTLDIRAALTGTLTRMHRVQRYSSVPVLRAENVAEHSWQVAILSMLIGRDIMEDPGSPVLNFGSLLGRAISHDVSEALSGDIIRSYKHSSPKLKDACDEADEINMERLVKELGRGAATDTLWGHWRTAKKSVNFKLEGEIVAFCDLLCVISYCVEEHALGNTRILFILKRMYEETLSEWHDHPWLGKYVNDLFPNRKWDDPLQQLTEFPNLSGGI